LTLEGGNTERRAVKPCLDTPPSSRSYTIGDGLTWPPSDMPDDVAQVYNELTRRFIKSVMEKK